MWPLLSEPMARLLAESLLAEGQTRYGHGAAVSELSILERMLRFQQARSSEALSLKDSLMGPSSQKTFFLESIAKGSSVQSPSEKYIGSSTQSNSTRSDEVHRLKCIVSSAEVHRVKCIVHRVKYIRVKYID